MSFTYNDGGIRTSKTVNGVTTTYYLDGSRIVGEETNGNITVYFYDSLGLPIGFGYHASTYASGAFDVYWYEKNLQGDIVAVYNHAGEILVSYVYDAWGNYQMVDEGDVIPGAAMSNPFTYRGYYYDNDLGLYYLNSRYYDAGIGRFISADDSSYLGLGGNLSSYNLYAYCGNNPVMGYDPIGMWDWGAFGKGASWLAIGITAVCVGVSVLTCGVAAPAMVAVAAVTVGAGALTAVNGLSEIGEAATGHNFVRDDIFQGNETAYDIYANATAIVAEIGTMICGGWLKSGNVQTKIADNKLQKIMDNPSSISNYNTKQFNRIAQKSSWDFSPTANGKGFRVTKGEFSIRYNMNGTRFDASHFGGDPYWVVSSGRLGKLKFPFR